MTKCDEVYRHICEHLDQELRSPQCKEIYKHLEGCTDCRAYLDSLKQTVSLYRALPLPKIPETVHARLIGAISLSRTKPRTPQRGRNKKTQSRKH